MSPTTSDRPVVVLAAMLRLQERVASFNAAVRRPGAASTEEWERELAERWAHLDLGKIVYTLYAAATEIQHLTEEAR